MVVLNPESPAIPDDATFWRVDDVFDAEAFWRHAERPNEKRPKLIIGLSLVQIACAIVGEYSK